MTELVDTSTELIERARAMAGPTGVIAFVSGNFNVVHPGHLRLLKFAAETSDVLVVAVNPDTTPGVNVPAALRLEGISAIDCVSMALLLRGSPAEFIGRLKPHVVVKGREFEGRRNAEQAAVNAYGGKLLFSSGEMRFASTELLNRDYTIGDFSGVELPIDYTRRHGFDIGDIREYLNKFSDLSVVVVGDLIIDTYIDCDALGMSQEDPTIVVSPIEERSFVGGAGIVAAHARGLGAKVKLLTVAGEDWGAEFGRRKLEEYGVEAEILIDGTRPTTNKRRYRSSSKTLLRVNKLRQHAVAPMLAGKMLRYLDTHLNDCDLLLFSDFNYGALPQRLVKSATAIATQRGIKRAADSQASSQLADISRFKNMELITPTEREARLALQDFDSGLVAVIQRLREKSHADHVLVTLGSEGMLIHGKKDGEYTTDRLPAFNKNPKDPAGAGDSLMTCCALGLAAGLDIWRAAYIGSLAAALQVSRVGNIPLQRSTLIHQLEESN